MCFTCFTLSSVTNWEQLGGSIGRPPPPRPRRESGAAAEGEEAVEAADDKDDDADDAGTGNDLLENYGKSVEALDQIEEDEGEEEEVVCGPDISEKDEKMTGKKETATAAAFASGLVESQGHEVAVEQLEEAVQAATDEALFGGDLDNVGHPASYHK